MKKRSKIAIISLSASLNQNDYLQGMSLDYNTQLESLRSYLTSEFNIFIDLVVSSTNLNPRIRSYGKYQVTQLPRLNIPIVSSIFFNLVSFLYLTFNRRPSIIYAWCDVGTYPYIGALLYAKLRGISLFLDVRNPLYSYEALPSSFSLTRRALYIKVLSKIADMIVAKYSNKIIHGSEKSKLSLKSDSELFQKSLVASSCARSAFFTIPGEKNTQNKGLTFAYWGTIHRARRLDVVIRGFAKAKRSNRNFNAKFYLIGNGEDAHRLKKIARDLEIPDIVFKDYMVHEKLCNFLRDNVSVAVVAIPQTEFFQLSSPLKLVEAIAMKLPIIASDIDPNRMVKEHNIGILCNHTEDSYAKAFLEFWSFSEDNMNRFRKNCHKIRHLFMPRNVFRELRNAIESHIEKGEP